MKKGAALALLLAAGLPAASAEWKLPVVTMKYELAGGTVESPDPDEDILIPSSVRNTVSLRVKEDGPVDLGLSVRYSTKDYLVQAGDYTYLSLEHDARAALSRELDLGYLLGVRWVASPELDSDGLSKDYLALKGGLEASLGLLKGTDLTLGAAAQCELHKAEQKGRQLYGLSLGFSSRVGQWQVSARYRGEARLALGPVSVMEPSILNVGSLSLQWDPNK